MPEGQYLALCIDVYDAGWWEKMEGDGWAQKCKIVFVLDDNDDEGKPYLLDIFETLSLHEKANLHKLLVSWRGKAFTPEQLKGFDLETLVNVGALIQVVHKPKKNGGARAMVGAIMLPPKGSQLPSAPANYVRDRDREEPFADKHPAPKGAGTSTSDDGADDALNDEDDDLPF